MTKERRNKIFDISGRGVSGNKENVQIELLMEILEKLEALLQTLTKKK